MTRINKQPSVGRKELLGERAREMRWMPTPSERLLWAHIRGRRLGVVFRRQVPLLGRFIADFLAPARRLVVEVDGGYHAGRERADAQRDAALQRAGYRVLRLEADLVLRDVERAVECVRGAL
jgi:very-short-patch-repair endonuclease